MDDEKFFAWLDGELPADEAKAIASIVAENPELAAKAEAHRMLKAKLSSAFQPIANQPFELRGAKVVDLAQRRVQKRGLPTMSKWGAIAATLLVGIVTGTMIKDREARHVAEREGVLVASGDLDTALDTQLASAPVSRGPRVGLTFRDQSGSVCRTFTDSSAQGIACRHESDWRLRTLVQGAEASSGDYRMAAGMDPALGATLSSIIAGEPYDAAQEKAAMNGDWR
jgi:hypothetical protein